MWLGCEVRSRWYSKKKFVPNLTPLDGIIARKIYPLDSQHYTAFPMRKENCVFNKTVRVWKCAFHRTVRGRGCNPMRKMAFPFFSYAFFFKIIEITITQHEKSKVKRWRENVYRNIVGKIPPSSAFTTTFSARNSAS